MTAFLITCYLMIGFFIGVYLMRNHFDDDKRETLSRDSAAMALINLTIFWAPLFALVFAYALLKLIFGKPVASFLDWLRLPTAS